jgi:endoglucanase
MMARALLGLAFFLLIGGMSHAQTLELRRGVNLEAWLDQPVFNPIGEAQLAQLAKIKASGFDFVRILVNAQYFIDARAGNPEPNASLSRFLATARKNNLKTLVALTNSYPNRLEEVANPQKNAVYLAFLEKFSKDLTQYDAKWVALEPFVEYPDCNISLERWMQVRNQMVSAVRNSNKTMTLLMNAWCYSDGYNLTLTVPANDKNIIYGFQYLKPLQFTQQGNTETPGWAYFKNVPYPYTQDQLQVVLKTLLKDIADPKLKQEVKKTFEDLGMEAFNVAVTKKDFRQVYDWSKKYSVKVLLSSFAVNQNAPTADRLRWFNDVRTTAEASQMAWSVWSWTSPFGYGITENGKLSSGMQKALKLP